MNYTKTDMSYLGARQQYVSFAGKKAPIKNESNQKPA